MCSLLFSEKNTVEAKAWLDKNHSDFVTGKPTVKKWFAKFKPGEMSTEDDTRSGRLNENFKKVHKIILDELKVKLIEETEALKGSKERVGQNFWVCESSVRSGYHANSKSTKTNEFTIPSSV